MTLQVDQNVQFVFGDPRGGVRIGHIRNVDAMLHRIQKALAIVRLVRLAVVVRKDFELLAIVMLEHADHQQHGRVMAEVRGRIADANAARLALFQRHVAEQRTHVRRHLARHVRARDFEVVALVRAPRDVGHRKFVDGVVYAITLFKRPNLLFFDLPT